MRPTPCCGAPHAGDGGLHVHQAGAEADEVGVVAVEVVDELGVEGGEVCTQLCVEGSVGGRSGSASKSVGQAPRGSLPAHFTAMASRRPWRGSFLAPEDNPTPVVEPNRSSSALAGDAARMEPLPSPTQVDRARLPHGRVSAGEQAQGSNGGGNLPATATVAGEGGQQQQQQMRVSLMALLEQTDGQVGGTGFAVSALLEGAEDEEEGEEERGGKAQHQAKCCVCMVRKKGAAFIPCGHTFCRLCSRQLWVSRGTCPLCNGFILEVLDIF